MNTTIKLFRTEIQQELENNILPFWMSHMVDGKRGGFFGRIAGNNINDEEAPKGAILNARILWTFSAAYRLLKKEQYLSMATRAKRYLIDMFYDRQFGGVYWELDYKGSPLNTKKQIYAMGFAIYGLSEYHRATGDKEALDYAIRLFNDIETYSFDHANNGYYEALTREWGMISDMRLSKKDINESKTTNTHLHILEPYTNLYRVWKDKKLQGQLKNLIELFTDRIIDEETKHLQLFFDDCWNTRHNLISYGHDIEASWLLHQAALVLDDSEILSRVEFYTVDMAEAATEGFLPGGGMIYEFNADKNSIDADRHWWVQAEAIIGYINLYQHFGDKLSLLRAMNCWDFIKRYLIDYQNGEWLWSIRADGAINSDEDKAGFWKCPYHNGRMCMEIMERFSS